MVSTSGAQLLPETAIRNICDHLFKQTTVLTPNIPEAILLLKENNISPPEIRSVADLESIARSIQKLGPQWVLVKGGHAPLTETFTAAQKEATNKVVIDVLVGPNDEIIRIQAPWQESKNTHGTGCSLACEYLFHPFTYSKQKHN